MIATNTNTTTLTEAQGLPTPPCDRRTKPTDGLQVTLHLATPRTWAWDISRLRPARLFGPSESHQQWEVSPWRFWPHWLRGRLGWALLLFVMSAHTQDRRLKSESILRGNRRYLLRAGPSPRTRTLQTGPVRARAANFQGMQGDPSTTSTVGRLRPTVGAIRYMISISGAPPSHRNVNPITGMHGTSSSFRSPEHLH